MADKSSVQRAASNKNGMISTNVNDTISASPQKAAARLPAGEWASIPRYGHLVHEENAASVAALILPFLAAHCLP